MQEKVYSVGEKLPAEDQEVFCFGHRTICCEKWADPNPDWYRVTYIRRCSSYIEEEEIDLDNIGEEIHFQYYEWVCVHPRYCINDIVVKVSKWKEV